MSPSNLLEQLERRAPWVVVGFALCLAALLHGPALQTLGTHLPGEPASDVLRAWWSSWLVAEELPTWPFSTTRANFPVGLELLPFPAVSLVIVAPVAWLLGPAVAVTALVVLHSVLAVLAGAALVRTLGGGWGGALMAGALVATQPILGGALRDGTVEILAVGWVPLTMLAMVRACQGSWRWGLAAGGLYLATCLESVYYGSFTALAVLATLASIRSRAGVVGAGAAALAVALGAGLLAWAFWPVLEGARAALDSAGNDPAALRATNAAQLDLLRQLALHPGARGWRVGDLYGPPWPHWVVFGLGALLALRRAPWLPLLGGLYLLLALNDGLVTAWADAPLGEVVRFPRRYMAPVGVALGCAAGLGLQELLRRPRWEAALGLGLAGWLGWWGYHAGGWRQAYPLLQLPSVEFVAPIAADDEDCAVLLLPIERPGERLELRTQTPVFAGLSGQIASADHLALQVLMDKRAWYKPALVTLHAREGASGLTPKNFTDLALQVYGKGIPSSALLPADAYLPDLAWLMGEGLKYVVVDLRSYREAELARIDAVLGPLAVAQTDLADGTGVRVYRLYDERPAPTEVPAASTGVLVAGFSGRVVDWRDHVGRVLVSVRSADKTVQCPVTPEDGAFQCGGVSRVDDVHLVVDGVALPTVWEGSLLEAKVRASR